MAKAAEADASNTENDMVMQAYQEGFSLVSEEEFVDEEDSNIVHHITVFEREEDDGISTASANAMITKTYKVSYEAKVARHGIPNPEKWADMWIQGTFTYDNDAYIAVDGASVDGNVIENPEYNFELLGKTMGHESDKGANILWGRKYAIIWIDATMTNHVKNNRQTFHLSFDVNVNGVYHTDPRKGPEVEEIA